MSRTDSLAPADPEPDRISTFREIFAPIAGDAASTGFLLADLGALRGPVLWVQDRLSRREGGRPYATGLASLLGYPVELLHLEVRRPLDVLWAMEEALGCPALAAVVGEVWGDPPALDFTATKRLALRSERGGVPSWLLRHAARPDLSAARERWRVRALPSPPARDDLRAPGPATWQVELFRAHRRRPGTWVAQIGDHGLRLGHHAPLAEPRRATG